MSSTLESFNSLGREQIYELVWTKPMASVATEFGVSDVALKKRCRKLAIPTPSRGYWVKVEHGQKPARTPLPATIGANSPQVPASAHHSQWPREVLALCDRAQGFLTAIKASELNYKKLHKLESKLYPRAEVSAATCESAARLFHALLFAIEGTGIPFRKSSSKYEAAYFEVEGERLHLEMNEELRAAKPSYASWRASEERPTGNLTVTLADGGYGGRWKKGWTQGQDGGLREMVASIMKEVVAYSERKRQEHAAEAERRRIEHERWMVEEEKRKRLAHDQAIASAERTRAEDFFRAVEWTHLHKRALQFIAECESTWRAAGELTSEQVAWLEWARRIATAWSPAALGYPEPMKDGAFDPSAVPFGGPYPATRNLPRPPTMPEIPAAAAPAAHWQPAPAKPQFPFWLKHPR
jgi:hypothetical protein